MPPQDPLDNIITSFPTPKDLDLKHLGNKELFGLVSELPFEESMRESAYIAAKIYYPNPDRKYNFDLVDWVFEDEQLKAAYKKYLSQHDRAIALSEQHISIAQRLLFEYAHTSKNSVNTSKHVSHNLGMLLVHAGGLIEQASRPAGKYANQTELNAAILLRNGAYQAKDSERASYTRARAYLDISQRSNEKTRRDWVDLNEVMYQAYKVSYADQFAAGFTALAMSYVLGESTPVSKLRLTFPEQELEKNLKRLGLSSLRAKAAIELLVADPAWYQKCFSQSSNIDSIVWNRIPYEKRPLLRLSDGTLLLFSPRAMHSWLSTGFFHRLVGAAEQKLTKLTNTQGLRTYWGHLVETRVKDTVFSTIPNSPGLVKRVAGEVEYKKQKNTLLSPDISIQYPNSLVLMEVVSGALKQTTAVNLTPQSFHNDLSKRFVVDKFQQLDRRIEDFADGHICLPDVQQKEIETVWPVLVTEALLLQSEFFWDYIESKYPGVLSKQTLTNGIKRQPFTLLTMQQLEQLLAQAEKGIPVPTLLSNKLNSNYLKFGFDQWLNNKIGDNQPPKMIEGEFRKILLPIEKALGLK